MNHSRPISRMTPRYRAFVLAGTATLFIVGAIAPVYGHQHTAPWLSESDLDNGLFVEVRHPRVIQSPDGSRERPFSLHSSGAEFQLIDDGPRLGSEFRKLRGWRPRALCAIDLVATSSHESRRAAAIPARPSKNRASVAGSGTAVAETSV